MLLNEWNWDDAKAVWQEEAREEGMAQGIAQGMAQGAEKERARLLDLLSRAGSIEELKQRLTQS
jgi:flagellar biosynthesis/type III secretory pathway protein FliH